MKFSCRLLREENPLPWASVRALSRETAAMRYVRDFDAAEVGMAKGMARIEVEVSDPSGGILRVEVDCELQPIYTCPTLLAGPKILGRPRAM